MHVDPFEETEMQRDVALRTKKAMGGVMALYPCQESKQSVLPDVQDIRGY